ncbi:MAG: PRC-barrel domain-containing protein [Allosphingosinicella sp.]
MKPAGTFGLAADLRDLQIEDSEGTFCGIVDDIELDGKPGGKLTVAALLVGPGAWRGRLPRWAEWLAARLAGNRIVRVPWAEVTGISGVVALRRTAHELGLGRTDERLDGFLKRWSGHALR